MITVTIAINGHVIVHRGAVNVTPDLAPDKVHTYTCDDGNVIKHRRDLGSIPLAIKMLLGVEELK